MQLLLEYSSQTERVQIKTTANNWSLMSSSSHSHYRWKVQKLDQSVLTCFEYFVSSHQGFSRPVLHVLSPSHNTPRTDPPGEWIIKQG